ncbi:hypothetical protein [Sphingomonas bacterium]|uniref:hypothetical protein n=1 Tax=Sphingomonas bacterium TaxID=1895847 RepID=UPI002639DC59|nr:hypothetical protein [Sphingomonas bacterium]MDB5677098.1 hypothetical protein [Sphingomonas bacterium]
MAPPKDSGENDAIARHADGQPQRRRKPKADAFTPEKRQRFLDALAYTCNVRMACGHAGIDVSTAYYNRGRDPVFVEQWRDALATGYDALEALVLEHGGAGQALEPADPTHVAADAPPFDFDRALAVLRQYRGRRDGQHVRHGVRPIAATREETNAALRKALAAARKRMAVKPE